MPWLRPCCCRCAELLLALLSRPLLARRDGASQLLLLSLLRTGVGARNGDLVGTADDPVYGRPYSYPRLLSVARRWLLRESAGGMDACGSDASHHPDSEAL